LFFYRPGSLKIVVILASFGCVLIMLCEGTTFFWLVLLAASTFCTNDKFELLWYLDPIHTLATKIYQHYLELLFWPIPHVVYLQLVQLKTILSFVICHCYLYILEVWLLLASGSSHIGL